MAYIPYQNEDVGGESFPSDKFFDLCYNEDRIFSDGLSTKAAQDEISGRDTDLVSVEPFVAGRVHGRLSSQTASRSGERQSGVHAFWRGSGSGVCEWLEDLIDSLW